ncbi:DNA cytosine methyltransferase [Ancylomarina euxinus]|uniref:Cytosine-specific methyltransferase n=1 Tax=Ancylomarina euxinus TaxID=2283627 RepID=A0A425Y147_9BACT|nr:DNA cytosine methyltransferase [Ancylomarina euxinus]MCZ4693784.1 DNA cytosine methyltransferase [Ancylomarina euxinus]MUP15136.1 DNA (cytosine-5-)-methyltransferase [Ancylomarina euxinus]RRG21559.1 DNA cytosine methyltransferase [Ancylomarina euxinus]
MVDSRKHIELFAGCGGMALGMEAAKFKLFFANELSPMAGETFAYNILGENLQEALENKKSAKNVKWVSSKYDATDLVNRLRENPLDSINRDYTDLKDFENFKEKLIIGDINELLEFFNNNQEVVSQIQKKNIDLLSGGPPCQGFSLAGLRKKDDYKNKLPMSFVKMAALIQPKVILLENVKGITSPFTENGKKHYAWLEVSKAFALNGFVPVCMMLNSKYFGVPQNRPRFILFAFRRDIFDKLLLEESLNEILNISEGFYNKVVASEKELEKITIKDFKYYNIEDESEYFNGNVLPEIITEKGEFISASSAIDDISNPSKKYKFKNIKADYSLKLAEHFINKDYLENGLLKNHEERNHGKLVKERFKIYQAISNLNNGLQVNAYRLITNKVINAEDEEEVLNALKQFKFGIKGEIRFKSNKELRAYISERSTRKHSQRALQIKEPAPAQLTIPDDVCHYKETRTLTVREMARFQSFPDWFVFRSKVTTGGNMRRFEVPQYTQVGNAVPPLLAEVLGKTISKLLDKIDE